MRSGLECGGDSGPEYDANCPLCEPEDFEDHVLHSCPIYYRWNGLFYSWTSCDNAWAPVANQPVFTNLNDCLIAKGHLLDENGTYWDNSQEDKTGVTLGSCSVSTLTVTRLIAALTIRRGQYESSDLCCRSTASFRDQ